MTTITVGPLKANLILLKITLIVFFIHVFTILYFFLDKPKSTQIIAQNSKVLVKTVHLKKELPKATTEKNLTKKVEDKKEETIAKPNQATTTVNNVEKKKQPTESENLPAKKSSKAIQKKKELSAKKDSKKENQDTFKKSSNENKNTNQQELLAKAQESIARIDKVKSKVDKSLEKTIIGLEDLKIDQITFDPTSNYAENTYTSELVYRLKTLLKLPEAGIVHIRLILSSSGKVKQVSVIKSTSKKNEIHIKKEIPNIVFSPFDKSFGNQTEHEFNLHLSHE